MMLFVPAHRSLRLLRTAEPQQESKALIKLTLCYSPCSYPMLFSCQKSPALRRPTLGGLSTSSYSGLPKVRRQATGARYPLQKCTVSLLTPNLRQYACRFENSGGADRDRTGDPLVANQVLSQLSYSPVSVVGCQFAVVSRFY